MSEKLLLRTTTAIEVADVLRQRILSGQYQAGDYLRQEHIAQELGVSRQPVREAQSILETEGLLVRETYRGVRVPEVSVREIHEIYQLNGMVEPYLLEQAFPQLDDAIIEEAQQVLDISTATEDPELRDEANWRFHKLLYSPANSPLAMQILEQLLSRTKRYMLLQQRLPDNVHRESDQQHQHLLNLIKMRDCISAVTAIREHIRWNEHVMSAIVLKSAWDEE